MSNRKSKLSSGLITERVYQSLLPVDEERIQFIYGPFAHARDGVASMDDVTAPNGDD